MDLKQEKAMYEEMFEIALVLQHKDTIKFISDKLRSIAYQEGFEDKVENHG